MEQPDGMESLSADAKHPIVIGTDLRKPLMGIAVFLACLVWAANAVNLRYDVREVDVSAATKLIRSGAVIVDVRGKSQHAARRIPGALSIPLEELRAGIPAQLLDIARHESIIVYCSHGVLVGPEATDLLNRAGFAGAVNLKAGFEGWAGAGRPVGRT